MIITPETINTDIIETAIATKYIVYSFKTDIRDSLSYWFYSMSSAFPKVYLFETMPKTLQNRMYELYPIEQKISTVLFVFIQNIV